MTLNQYSLQEMGKAIIMNIIDKDVRISIRLLPGNRM